MYTDIYIPFTYYLYHKPTKQKYYGAKFAAGCQPSDLWTTYFSSSKKVHKLIEEYGLDSFDVKVRKIFTTKIDCLLWEETVLTRIHILEKDDWLNDHIGGHRFRNNGHHNNKVSQEMKNYLSEKFIGAGNPFYGKNHDNETLERIRIGRRKAEAYRDDTYRMELLEKWYKFTSPTNEIFIVKGQTKFCREYGLNQGNITSVVKGRYKQCLGWRCKDYDINIDTLDPFILY